MRMTDIQLYFAAGIPTFAILIGILTNIVHHNAVNARFNTVENRISSLENRIDARFNNLEVKFDTLTGKVIDLDNRVTRIEAKLGIT
jgi:flagellar capping protein FliD